MTKLPEGRKPLPNEWFIDRAKQISPMTDEERKRAKQRKKANSVWRKCVSCGGPAQDNFCGFCLEEE
jgi:hypothetical protein